LILENLKALFPKAFSLYLNNEPLTRDTIIQFLDDNDLFVCVSTDAEGINWFVEISGIPLTFCNSRNNAMDYGILEGLSILETF
jgi:hypothetical protein